MACSVARRPTWVKPRHGGSGESMEGTDISEGLATMVDSSTTDQMHVVDGKARLVDVPGKRVKEVD